MYDSSKSLPYPAVIINEHNLSGDNCRIKHKTKDFINLQVGARQRALT